MKTALITGAAKRIGAATARRLHGEGYNIVIHYRSSRAEAETLLHALDELRPGSAVALGADLSDSAGIPGLIARAHAAWGRLDAVVNNASSFYPTPLGTVNESNWDDLIGSNLKGPFFICQSALPYLRETGGGIVNLVDIYAWRPLAEHSVYCAAKAGLLMLTRSLALEMGPDVRVNAIAPGAILWPEGDLVDSERRQRIVRNTALKRRGTPEGIAAAVNFLLSDEANYVTGQILSVDGGRSLMSQGSA